MSREKVSSPPLLFTLCLSFLMHTLGGCDDSSPASQIYFPGRYFVQWRHSCMHLVYIKPCFHCACECIAVFAVMHCWSQSDAINSVSLGLKEIVNHISYSGKQRWNGTLENCWVHSAACSQWHNEKEKHAECAHLMASHMLILMTGLPAAQVRWSRGCGKEVNAPSHSHKL